MQISAKRSVFVAFAAVMSLASHGCGRSLYAPAATKDTDAALKEEAIIALNDDDYATASSALGTLWEKGKTNELAQLYAISLVGEAGYSLFDVVKKALTSVSDDSSKSSAAGNAILDKITNAVGTDVTTAQLDTMKKAITVLLGAPDQASAGLTFQKCLTAGIYAAPTLGGLAETVADLDATLKALPTKLQASGSSCNASAAEVNAVGEELTDVLTKASELASRIRDVEAIMGGCLPKGSTDSVNQITSKVNTLASASDKGCSIPATGQLGGSTLPACMNSFVLAAGGSTAKAGDGAIAGCEVFLNCTGGKKCL